LLLAAMSGTVTVPSRRASMAVSAGRSTSLPLRAATKTAPAAKPMSLKRLEWEHIERVLRECDGNVSAAARALSMHRRTLQRKLAKRPVRK